MTRNTNEPVHATVTGVRDELTDMACEQENHADLLDTVAAGLDEDGFPQHASRARARAATLRETAAGLRGIAGPDRRPRWGRRTAA